MSEEDSKLAPWTGLAKYKLKAEEELAAIEGFVFLLKLVLFTF